MLNSFPVRAHYDDFYYEYWFDTPQEAKEFTEYLIDLGYSIL